MSGQILAIDQGTHSSRALVFDVTGRLIGSAQQGIALHRISRARIEQSADEILHTTQTVIRKVLEHPAVDRDQLCCAGLATQRSSVLGWDRESGSALGPLLSWQDRRAAARLTRLADKRHRIHQLTGLQLSPHYGASKLQWLLENNDDVKASNDNGTLALGPLASYLLHHLTDCAHDSIDDANAARTLLWNIDTHDWDAELCTLFDIPPAVLPRRRPIRSNFGCLSNAAIPLTACNGDQTAALYARGQPDRDSLYINIGTGAFVILPVAGLTTPTGGLLTGISSSWQSSAEYFAEGTVNSAAAALKWVAARYKLEDHAASLPAWLDRINSPALFINTLGGLGSPWWKDGPAAYFTDSEVSGEVAMVAAVESIVFLIQANLAHLRPLNPSINGIRISGGLANVDAVCQKIADLSGLPVERPVQVEATARGIAWLAAACPSSWEPGGIEQTFIPRTNAGLYGRYARFMEILQSSGG